MRWLRSHLAAIAMFLLFVASPAFSQQAYVSRYDTFAGYTFLDSPHVHLFESGFHLQAGVRPKTWYSLGFDYSVSAGTLTLTPDLLTVSLQQQLAAQLQQLAMLGVLPAEYMLKVPTHSLTQTFAVGPQLVYRRFSRVTLFMRPSIGAIREVATPHPRDQIAAGVVTRLAPSGQKTDWTGFYGFGGGIDILASKHVAIRVQADVVYDHLFSDLLEDGRWTMRFSMGPAFNFGRNIRK